MATLVHRAEVERPRDEVVYDVTLGWIIGFSLVVLTLASLAVAAWLFGQSINVTAGAIGTTLIFSGILMSVVMYSGVIFGLAAIVAFPAILVFLPKCIEKMNLLHRRRLERPYFPSRMVTVPSSRRAR